ncbi:MAG TPA: hypothetical protein VMM80_11305 [Bacteroidota bacterium]|nr:hypothetical protein [Bacteroidota bacterium]
MNRFACLLVCVVLAAPAAADELWRQNPVDTVGGYASQDARNPGGLGFFAEAADNFQAQNGWTINQVEFWGGYVQVTPPNTHGFTIRFYTDDDGHPGTMIYQQDILTFTEEVYYVYPGQGWLGYHYVVNLPSGFALPGAGQYWLSVVAILDYGGSGESVQWGWAQALTVNPPVTNQRFFSPSWAPQYDDEGFVLNGTTGGAATGACCLPNGSCMIGGQGDCMGVYQSDGSICSPNPCQQPQFGACCVVALCTVGVLQGDCAGVWDASNSCAIAAGPPHTFCCPGNYNRDAVKNVSDIFAMLTGWFQHQPAAEWDGNGLFQVIDIFAFLADWFRPC